MSKEPIVLIMCGGRSLRLWPLSEYKSKNFLDIFEFSPLEVTLRRFLKITSRGNIFLVANKKEKENLNSVELINRKNIFFEPESKNTAAAVLLSLFRLKERFPLDKHVIISPVDNLIDGEKSFFSDLNKCLKIAQAGWISTLGMKPLHPTPNFGYIQVDKEVEKGVFSVKRFVEKPSRCAALRLINRGNSFYNSGMFISCLSVLDGEYKRYYPYYNDFLIAASSDKKLSSFYKKIENTPFDKAIMEKTKKIRLIPAGFSWKDFGNWNAIYDVLPKDSKGNVKKGNVFLYKSRNSLMYLRETQKKVLGLGLENIVFIDTPEYVLLARREYLDELKSALNGFKK